MEFTYDSNGRVTAKRRYAANGVEDLWGRVDYYYDSQSFDGSFTQNAMGRLAAVSTGYMWLGAGQVIEMYSYNVAGAVTKKRLRVIRPAGTLNLDAEYGYGSDGKLATLLYPGETIPYAYSYDLMDRPVKMTGPSDVSIDVVKNVVYGVAGQITSMQYLAYETESHDRVYTTETRTYNELFQLTRQTGAGTDLEYRYAATANNGRITSRKNYVSGEDVSYSYDELNRLVSASVSGTGGWGQTYTHDGFGNLWTQAVTKGTAPVVSLSVDMATNRINSSNWVFDANGNTTGMPVVGGGTASMSYDIENRLLSWSGVGGRKSMGTGRITSGFGRRRRMGRSTCISTGSMGGNWSRIPTPMRRIS